MRKCRDLFPFTPTLLAFQVFAGAAFQKTGNPKHRRNACIQIVDRQIDLKDISSAQAVVSIVAIVQAVDFTILSSYLI